MELMDVHLLSLLLQQFLLLLLLLLLLRLAAAAVGFEVHQVVHLELHAGQLRLEHTQLQRALGNERAWQGGN